MDAKARAEFINSLGNSNENIYVEKYEQQNDFKICPKCNTKNDTNDLFCGECGAALKNDNTEKSLPFDDFLEKEVVVEGCELNTNESDTNTGGAVATNNSGNAFPISNGVTVDKELKEDVHEPVFVPVVKKKLLRNDDIKVDTPFSSIVEKQEVFDFVDNNQVSAFAPVDKKIRDKKEVSQISFGSFIDTVIDEPSVFAQGLPDWSIVPPNVMVRRNRKK